MPIIDVTDVILESVKDDKDKILTHAKRIYQHLLKWKYQPSRQHDSTWITTIITQSNNIKNIIYNSKKQNTNVINRANDELVDTYNRGIIEAINETHIENIRNDNFETFNDFNNLDYLTDFNYIIDWLAKYATNKGLKYLINNQNVKKYYTGFHRNEWY